MKVFLPLLVFALLCGTCFGELCPQADLSGDCRVDWEDMAIFAEQWLGTGGCSHSGCGDFDGASGIDMKDFSVLAGQWGDRGAALFINEFMASNSSASDINDPAGDYDDWIEIYNAGEVDINIGGTYLTDTLAEPNKWQVPTGYPQETTIAAGGFLVIWADEEPGEGPLHAEFKLSRGGEEIGLIDTDGVTVIDSVTFGEQTTNISYGRYDDGNDNWRFFPTATPGAENNEAYLGFVESPEFSHFRGFYETDFDVIIASVTPGVAVYYTVDGSEPIENEVPSATASLYPGALHIDGTTCLRATAIKTGWLPSPATTHTYIFGASDGLKSLPVISLVGDANKTFFEPNGIMAIVGGYYDSSGVWQPDGPDSYNNPMQRGIEYERPVSAELLWADGNELQIDCGIRVRGSGYTRPRYTRGDDWWGCWNKNRFSFNLFFRSSYGSKRLEYAIFPFTDIERYRSIALRGGHNDSCNPFIRDEWARRLHKQMGAVEVTGSFLNLCLNGDYKFYYNPCGRIDQEFLQEWFKTDSEFDIITNSGVRDGDNVAFNSLVNYVRGHDLSINAHYQYVAERLDIEAFIDYLVLQIYSGNWDWPVNNWTVHRERAAGGKFRFGVWDAEGLADAWALGASLEKTAFDSFPFWWTWSAPGLNNIEDGGMCELYRAMKANADFRQLWADRTHKHFNNGGTLSKQNLETRFWELADEVSGVIEYIDTYMVDTFIPLREGPVLAAFDANGLFKLAMAAPMFKINGAYQHGGYISSGDQLSMVDPCSAGTIYYTLDGNDPRVEPRAVSTELVGVDAAKKVLIPTYDIGTSWRGGSEPYDDSGWTSGFGTVGYDTGTGYDELIDMDVEGDMYGQNSTCLIRIPFTVSSGQLSDFATMTLKVRYDDGFVVYLNGDAVAGKNSYGVPGWHSAASRTHEATGFEEFNLTSYLNKLQVGNNILAVHGLNISETDSDFLIGVELLAAGTAGSGGDVSPSAVAYTGSVALDHSCVVKSRVYDSGGDEWSSLNEAVYALGEVGQDLRVSEMMYHPAGTAAVDANSEYIELKNVGASSINLNLASFTEGIHFTFAVVELAAGERVLVVKDMDAFEAKYGTGRNVAGQYSGSLDNGGERIRLEDALGTAILDFEYKDGWRSITDGDGYSLTIINPASADVNDWSRKDSWRPSAYIDGSPGWDDSGIVPNPGAVVINEVMAHTDTYPNDWIELYNTTNGAIDISGWFLSDSDTNVMKYEFEAGTVIDGYGYLVVTEDTNFGPGAADAGSHIAFALSENGEIVCLWSAVDGNGMLTGYRQLEDFGASERGVSIGRYYKASTDNYNFVAMDGNTPGTANAYPKVGPIVITEIMYHPDWPANSPYNNDCYEYVELRNGGGTSVVLYDYAEGEAWKFTDGIDYTFPDSPSEVTIGSGNRIIIAKDPNAFSWRYPTVPSGIIYGPYDGWLANDGEKLELGKPGDELLGTRYYIRVERVNYSDGVHPGDEPGDVDLWPVEADGGGKSLTRTSTALYGNDPNNWTAQNPSPGG